MHLYPLRAGGCHNTFTPQSGCYNPPGPWIPTEGFLVRTPPGAEANLRIFHLPGLRNQKIADAVATQEATVSQLSHVASNCEAMWMLTTRQCKRPGNNQPLLPQRQAACHEGEDEGHA